MNKSVLINKSSIIIAMSLIFFVSIFRFLLPYSDEPDFFFRVEAILHSDSVYSFFYFFRDMLNSYHWLDVNSEGFEQKSLRIFITLCLILPLLSFIIFRKQIVRLVRLMSHSTLEGDLDLRVKALSLSLLLPGTLYYLGVFAEEQFTLMLSLFLIVFWNHKVALWTLVSGIIFVDFGNGVIVAFFVLFFIFFERLNEKHSKNTIIIMFLLLMLITFIVGMKLILLLSFIPVVGEKAASIYGDYSTYYSYVETKYPLILRPVITFFTAVFMTPNKLGAYLLYPIYTLFLMICIYKLFKKSYQLEYKKRFLYLTAPIVFVTCIVFMLPGYSQAKYYMFVTPFIIYGIMKTVSFNKIFLFLFFSDIVVILVLFLNLL